MRGISTRLAEMSRTNLALHLGLAGVYCECSPELLRVPTKSFHPRELSRFSFFGLCITLYNYTFV